MRLNTICGGILLASLGFVLGWEILDGFIWKAVAYHADTGLHAATFSISQTFLTSLTSSIMLFLAGVGLSLFAIFHDRRLK